MRGVVLFRQHYMIVTFIAGRGNRGPYPENTGLCSRFQTAMERGETRESRDAEARPARDAARGPAETPLIRRSCR